MTPRGRLLGIDFGLARIGLAVCDADRRIASPLATYERRNAQADLQFFRRLVAEEEITGLVVGLPLHMSGDESEQSRLTRQFAEELAQCLGLPVAYQDERCTSSAADALLADTGLTPKRRKGRRDRVAAQMILQSYIETQRRG